MTTNNLEIQGYCYLSSGVIKLATDNLRIQACRHLVIIMYSVRVGCFSSFFDTAINSSTDFHFHTMVKNCITMANMWQPAGDKGKGKDKGKDMGKVQGIAQAKARAEDNGEGKSKACSKANQMRRAYRRKSQGICICRAHKCYGARASHFSCGLMFIGSEKAAHRAQARRKAEAKEKPERAEIEDVSESWIG